MSLKEFITTSYGVEIYLDTKKLRQAKVWYPRTKNQMIFLFNTSPTVSHQSHCDCMPLSKPPNAKT